MTSSLDESAGESAGRSADGNADGGAGSRTADRNARDAANHAAAARPPKRRRFSFLRAHLDPVRRTQVALRRFEHRPRIDLADIRRARDVTQALLADALETSQHAVSRLERRADMRVSTLRRYIDAIGGELELTARFLDGTRRRLTQFDAPISPDAPTWKYVARMSMAFLRDDPPDLRPQLNHRLPPRDDPGFDAAAARALLEGARVSEIMVAEDETGYRFGEPKLRSFVEVILAEARKERDDRLEQVAERFLRV